MKRIQVIIAFPLFFYVTVFGQNDYKRRPFPFKGLSTEFQKEVNNSKPHIFYLFSSACSGAYDPLLRLKSLQDSIGGQLQVALIGRNNYKTQTDYKHYKEFYHYEFPVTFDSAIFKALLIRYDPTLVWVNSEGEIIAQTGTAAVNQENLFQFIHHGIPPKVHSNKVLGPPNIIYISKLSEGQDGVLLDAPFAIEKRITSFQAQAATMEQLFQLAFLKRRMLYYGDSLYAQIETTPMLEDFTSADSLLLKKKYNYSFRCADSSQTDITEWMQQDLQRIFPFKARLYIKQMPYWAFIAINGDTTKVATKYKVTSGVASNTEIKVNNCERFNLLVQLRRFYPFDPVIIDETNMKGNIDIQIEGVLSDFATLKAQLNKNGFDIVNREKPTKVLVLTPKNESVTRH